MLSPRPGHSLQQRVAILNQRRLRIETLEDRTLLVADIDSDLVGFWKLDELAIGQVVIDASGMGNDGAHANIAAPNGPNMEVAIDEGADSRSLQFDGINDQVTIPSSASLDFSGGQFTLSVWIDSDALDDGWHGVMGYQNGPVTSRGPSLWVFQQDRVHGGFGDGTAWRSFTTPSVLQPDGFNHIATTYDGTDYIVYVNGQQVFSQGFYSGQTPAPTDGYWLGRVDNRFEGLIDHVRIYTRALTGEDVQALYDEQDTDPDPPDPPSGLLAHFKLDEPSIGNPVIDETGLGHVATHVNIAAPQGPSTDVAVLESTDSRSLLLDGADDYVDVVGSAFLDLSGGMFSQSVWVNPSGNNPALHGVLGFDGGSNDQTPSIWVENDDQLHVGFGDGTQFVGFSTGNVLDVGQWNHVATTFDGDTYRIFVNGSEVATSMLLSGRTPLPLTSLNIGRVDTHIDGRIDEVRIYNRPLDVAEIEQLADANNPLNMGLVAHWRLDQKNIGDVAVDETGNAADGVPLNFQPPHGPNESVAVVEGANPRSVSFDGLNDYIAVPASESLDFSGGQFTQSVWLLSQVPDDNYYGVIGHQTTVIQRAPSIWIKDQTRIHAGFGDGTSWGAILTDPVLNAGEFNHVVVTFDGSVFSSYANGQLVHSVTYLAGRTPYPDTEFDIGRVDGNFAGLIDDVRLYDRALDASEVTLLYDTTRVNGGVVELADNQFIINEDAGTATVTLVRSGGADTQATVDFTTPSGDATPGLDYVETSGTAVFEVGEFSTQVDIPILDDPHGEGNESFGFATDQVNGATLGTTRTAKIIVIDDDVPPDMGSGLTGEYFEQEDFTELELTRLDSRVEFDWEDGVPDPSLDDDGFSVRWTGFVEPRHSEMYTFLTTSDDGVRLWIDNQLIIDEFVAQMATTHSGSIDLLANHRYEIQMEYFDGLGPASARLEWQSASQPREVIPAKRLYDDPSDQAIVSFGDTSIQVNESDATATVTVHRSGNLASVLFVTVSTTSGSAVAGDDYQSVNSMLAILPLETSGTIDIPIVDDLDAEPLESFSVTLSNPFGAVLGLQSTATVEIADDDPGQFALEVVASGINDPISIDFLSDGRLLVTGKGGIVHVIDEGVVNPTPFLDIREQVNHRSDRGLMGIAVHPDFANFPYVYVSFTYDPPETQINTGNAGPDGNGNRVSRVIRVEADPTTNFATAIEGSEEVILGTNSIWENITEPETNGTITPGLDSSCGVGGTIRDCIPADSLSHGIGEISFGPDGMLYVASGDGGAFGRVDPRVLRVQNENSLSGKLLRIDPMTGQGLPDNPFFDGDPDSNASKVYSLGLRNPFRFGFNPDTGEPFIGDVGWSTWEEINTGRGANFGWPFFEGGDGVPEQTGGYQDLDEAHAFYDSGVQTEPPFYARHHNTGARAIILGDFYTGNTFPALYQGALFYGDANQGIIDAITFDAAGQIESVLRFTDNLYAIVDIVVGPDGNLYLADLQDDRVLRYVAVSSGAAQTMAGEATEVAAPALDAMSASFALPTTDVGAFRVVASRLAAQAPTGPRDPVVALQPVDAVFEDIERGDHRRSSAPLQHDKLQSHNGGGDRAFANSLESPFVETQPYQSALARDSAFAAWRRS